jgi:MarR family transcriptional regulator for hemolysin
MVDRFERFSFAVFEISRYWHKIAADEMAKYGLKGSHATYLAVMYNYDDGITATKLGELCSRDKADVSRMMSIMEKKGLVKREGINKSLYRALIKLTGEGKAAAEQVRERARLAVEMAGKGISDEHRTILYDTLERIVANLQIIIKEGLPQL